MRKPFLILIIVVSMMKFVTSYRFLVSQLRPRILSPRFSTQQEIFQLPENTPFTVRQAYLKGMQWLKDHGIAEPEVSAKLLLCRLKEVGMYRDSHFKSCLGKSLSPESILFYNKMVTERGTSKPTQYIIGNWDFYGKEFICREPVLIPRPETEELVENILKSVQLLQKNITILDIGCGSGIIGITLCDQLQNVSQVVSIDISEAAQKLTTENANNILSKEKRDKFHCFQCDFESLLSKYPQFCGAFDLIVSNPPYISSNQISTLDKEVRLFEDHRALDGGKDGLDLTRKIIETAPKLFKENGLKTLWLELSNEHPSLLKNELIKRRQQDLSCPIESIESYQDYSTFDRFARIHFK